jgi:hypothetical protein
LELQWSMTVSFRLLWPKTVSRYGWLGYDTQSHCSNVRQGDHDISLPWLCWFSNVFWRTVMVSKTKCARPCHLDVVSLVSTLTGMQKARRFQLWSSRIYHTRPSSSPVRHTSFTTPYNPSFDYYTQYGSTSVWRTVTGSTTISTNYVSSTHEGMVTLENKQCNCLKNTDAWTIRFSHTDDDPHDTWTRFESLVLHSQWLGVPIPVLISNPRQCPGRQFNFDPYGETVRRVSVNLQNYQWSYIGSVCCYARLVTGMNPIKIPLLSAMNVVTSR